ncbi:MBL fold metallo-hydrolase [Thalassobacillus cyri]|uniref:MBL fold metallo-hydrolase n=1 Tax=Thalassobacillus cyri TaxID=571932 RepID=UPI000B84FD07|nr:MBL fold metallo-hydrolase [Thalassobacillus cyri]
MNFTKVEGGGYRIGIPVPFPMQYVYCYLLPKEDAFVLIDTGYNYRKAREAWEEVFRELSLSPGRIEAIFVTHFHPDHSGLADWMQNKTGAPVYMHTLDLQMMEQVWGEGSIQSQRIRVMAERHGVPETLSKEIALHMDKMAETMRPLPSIQKLDHEPVFMGRQWKVLLTPGHSDGMFCLYEESTGTIFLSDLILDPITPNISVWPGTSQRPLHEYFESLEKIRELPINIAYTAHGNPIYHVKERIDELIKHHEKRLSAMETLADHSTVYQIASAIFSHRKLNPHQWRFAIAETIAHMHYLEEEGRVKHITDKHGAITYQQNHQPAT